MAFGSLAALAVSLAKGELLVTSDSDVVIVPTASAFIGATDAAIGLSTIFEVGGAKVEALMNLDRSSSDEVYFARRVREADVVVLSDGSPLHAKSVWHQTSMGEALRDAVLVVSIGAVTSVLFGTMIDPRGGAPTMGLGYREGLVVTISAGEEQLSRTRTLLGDGDTLAVLGESGALYGRGARWRVAAGDVTITRGADRLEL